jgi:hypothetical protein
VEYLMKRFFPILAAFLWAAAQAAERLPEVTVYKDPNCGCCGNWVEHMKASGFKVKVVEPKDLGAVKARYGVPEKLASCHTAEVGGYVVEGHVPASTVKRLLKEKPPVQGVSVPGMPQGSPGMEVPGGKKDPYDVVSFDKAGKAKVYESFR